jgi:hypothetical protein
MLDDWWDTEEYQKQFVPYHEIIMAHLLECYLTRPQWRANILQSWYDRGEVLDREYRFHIENGYNTKEIERSIALYREYSEILREWIEHGTERAVPDTGETRSE